MSDTTLPDGWQWAVTPQDINRGIFARKLWWDETGPWLRIVLAHPSSDAAPFAQGVVEVVTHTQTKINRAGQRYTTRKTPAWANVRTLDLPPDPVAAAMAVELDLDTIMQEARDA